jgi:hypothetical protein
LAKRHTTSPPPHTITEVLEENKVSATDLPPAPIDSATTQSKFNPKQSSTIKKGIETALNSLAQVSKHAKYARNAAGILENMLSLKHQGESGAGSGTDEPVPAEDTT